MFTVSEAREYASVALTLPNDCSVWHNVAAVGAAVYALRNSKREANQILGLRLKDMLNDHITRTCQSLR